MQRLKDLVKKEEVNTRNRDKLRQKRKDDSNTEHLLFVKHMCQHRVTVRQCRDFKVVIEKDTVKMRCESTIGTKREWTFQLDRFFAAGVITIDLTEKWFNHMMLKITPGPFEIQKKCLVLNRKHRVEFTNIVLEEVATWKRDEDSST